MCGIAGWLTTWTASLKRYLRRDKTLRQRMGQLSYERIQAYAVHRMADQYAAVYDAIMQSASR